MPKSIEEMLSGPSGPEPKIATVEPNSPIVPEPEKAEPQADPEDFEEVQFEDDAHNLLLDAARMLDEVAGMAKLTSMVRKEMTELAFEIQSFLYNDLEDEGDGQGEMIPMEVVDDDQALLRWMEKHDQN